MIGQTLKDRYEIIEYLNESATYTAYQANDKRLGRQVSIHYPLPHLHQSSRQRFQQSAAAMSLLAHPNIVALYDMDEDDRQNPFLVVEYVSGEPLHHFIPSPPEQVVRLGQQIALALHHMHERGVIHREIKPASIHVTSNGQVKITDFELARLKDAKRVTAPGMVVGVPAYLAPEQAQGFALDHHADIYSLGVVLYELATGRLPFEADDIAALLLKHVSESPPSPRLINPDVPLALEKVILRALEKLPDHRFRSAQEMADALQAALHGIPPSETPPDPTQDSPVQPAMRIILADRQVVLRSALKRVLEMTRDYGVVGEAGDGEMTLQLCLSQRPDILVMDVDLENQNGLDILPTIREKSPETKILILTDRQDTATVTQALQRGAHGFVLKAAHINEVIEAIPKIVGGELVLGAGIAEKIVNDLME